MEGLELIMNGMIVSIHRVAANGGPAEELAIVPVRTNWGIEGDYRSRADKMRQLTLIEEEVLDQVGSILGHEVALGASRRQIVVRGLDLRGMIGKHLALGTVHVDVVGPCDPCERMNETIGPGGQAALGDWAGVVCRVLTGGQLRVGDSVQVLDSVSQTP
jgi:MOSC domain-containing protein YiiM